MSSDTQLGTTSCHHFPDWEEVPDWSLLDRWLADFRPEDYAPASAVRLVECLKESKVWSSCNPTSFRRCPGSAVVQPWLSPASVAALADPKPWLGVVSHRKPSGAWISHLEPSTVPSFELNRSTFFRHCLGSAASKLPATCLSTSLA